MAELKSFISWRIDVSNDDFMLILKALGGRLNQDDGQDYRPAAEALGDRLSNMKASILIDGGKAGTQLKTSIEEKAPPQTAQARKSNRLLDPDNVGRNLKLERSGS